MFKDLSLVVHYSCDFSSLVTQKHRYYARTRSHGTVIMKSKYEFYITFGYPETNHGPEPWTRISQAIIGRLANSCTVRQLPQAARSRFVPCFNSRIVCQFECPSIVCSIVCHMMTSAFFIATGQLPKWQFFDRIFIFHLPICGNFQWNSYFPVASVAASQGLSSIFSCQCEFRLEGLGAGQ